ncbi:MAG: acetate--CoA ligase family protein [Gemmatimonadota bacterium]|nr:MAG: acetate--CoA ligase family protein [Gemmatimonadota bacterium]
MNSLDPILRPKSIAVIGASRNQNTIGWHILDNLLENGFPGPVYPVNPKAEAIHSIRAYPSIGAVPGAVDLAVIVVPKDFVLAVAEECVDAGVKGLVVISAGFKEVGGEGVARERELATLVRERGVRMVGPNCMGVINNASDISMNATFAPATPPLGPVAFMSQSGAMGASVLDYAGTLGIGVSSFVSAGNKADVSGNDLIEFWRDDPDTGVILMYLESFGNPAHFVQLARDITRDKPICVVKSGRTGAGARAAASHTGALAGTDLATDAIIAQAGAIRAQTVEELFDLAMAFSNQPLPASNRVAIVTNAGGPGIIIADSCEAHGLEVTALTPETEQKLRERLPEEASVRNPVDLIASATPESYEFALSCVFDDPNVDSAIAAFVPPLGIQTKDVAAALVRVNKQHPEKPLLAVLMGRDRLPTSSTELHLAHVPAYIFPESAALALGTMWRYKVMAARQTGQIVEFETNDEAVEQIIEATLASGHLKLSECDALRVLDLYGVPVVPWRFVPADDGDLAKAAAAAVKELGLPVALKVVSPQIVHKTDVGGVVLGLESEQEVAEAVSRMVTELGGEEGEGGEGDSRPPSPSHSRDSRVIDGVLLQQMAPSGTETIVGITRVPRVGPMVMFGLGGIYVEALRDVVLRLCPLEDIDADEMIREVKLSALLEGIRGQAARDRTAIAEVVLRMSQLAMRHPRVAEMDINPLLAMEDGVLAVDARVQLSAEGNDDEHES